MYKRNSSQITTLLKHNVHNQLEITYKLKNNVQNTFKHTYLYIVRYYCILFICIYIYILLFNINEFYTLFVC